MSRTSSAASSLSRLTLFVLVSVVAGVLVAGAALPFVGGAGVAARTAVESYEALPSQLTAPPLPLRTRILASDGSVIAVLYEQNRVEIPLAQVAPVMRQAIVAVEDGRFYEHRGVDPRGVIRAFVGNTTDGSAAAGGGGSTLTQQYVKNVFLNMATTPEEQRAAVARSYTRKLKEMRYALSLERQYTKDEILEKYLNIAYFGAGAYGIEAAARRYFSKPASKLSLVEAATLAGAVQRPVAYDPTRNPGLSQGRRKQVLDRMAALGFITTAEAAKAAAIPTKSFLKPKRPSNGCTTSYAPFFCDYVYRVLRSDPAFGGTPAEREALLRRGGLTIRTTLEPKAQKGAQKAVDTYIPRKDKSRKVAAITMVRPGTGEVVAMAENRSWGTKGRGNTTYNFNVGSDMGGSLGVAAGSTFKAFTLAAAFEKRIDPFERIVSPPRKTFEGFTNCKTGAPYEPYSVGNSTGSGTFNMFQGTAYSVNTFFMGLEQKTGQCRPAEIAADLGLTKGDGKPLLSVPSFTLGTSEVTPLGMATAYGVFANNGVRCTTVVITRVTDRDGKDLRIPKGSCEEVMRPRIAASVTVMLKGVIDGPLPGRTGQAMSLGRDAAGKTGTINSSAAVWFVGYTPDLAAAVVTYDPRGNFPMKNITIGGRFYPQVFGSSLPGPIWKQAMLAALEGTPATKFDLRAAGDLAVKATERPKPTVTATPSASPSGSASGSPQPSPSSTPKPSGTPKPTPTPSPQPTSTKP